MKPSACCSDAAAWLEHKFSLRRAQAVELGDALVELGLLVHVLQEHPFRDEGLFYRLAASPAADRIGLGAAASCLADPGGVAVRDRSFHGRTYAQCWVGSDAVDLLLDGQFFYRFAWQASDTRAR